MRYQLRVTVHLGRGQGNIRRRDRSIAAYRQLAGLEPGACLGHQIAVHRHFAKRRGVLRIQRHLAADRCGLQRQAAAGRCSQVGADFQRRDRGVRSAGQRCGLAHHHMVGIERRAGIGRQGPAHGQ